LEAGTTEGLANSARSSSCSNQRAAQFIPNIPASDTRSRSLAKNTSNRFLAIDLMFAWQGTYRYRKVRASRGRPIKTVCDILSLALLHV